MGSDRSAADELRGGIRPLLFPRSLAIVGASPRSPEPVLSAVRSRLPAWGVHPSRSDVLGLPCSSRVADLPAQPELALLLVGHRGVEAAFEDAAAAGVRAFVLPGLGNESGAEGPPVAARLAARAEEIGAAVVGPNCMGVAVPGAFSPWIGTVPEDFVAGRVAVVAQSGSIGEAFLALGGRIGFRCVVSSGGEHVRDASDFLAFFADDTETGAIGLFLETVRRPGAFATALGLCADAGKPVVCLKVGRSRAAARAALAHTGALVGSQRAFSALLRSYGAIEVDDFPDLVETLEVVGRRRRPRGRRLGAVSESGGEAALLADHAQAAGLTVDPLPDGLAASLRNEFPNYLSPLNPLDAWAVDEPEVVYPRSFELLAASGAFDILVAQVDLSRYRFETAEHWPERAIAGLVDAVAGRDVFPAVTTVHTADPPPELLAFARERDLALLRGPGSAARALAAAARWRPIRRHDERRAPVEIEDLLSGSGALPELESSLVLGRYGIRFAPSRRAASPEEAAEAAAELGFPVVVKVDGPAHKAADGGVVLGISTPDAAAEAASRLSPPVLVARQLDPGPEAFCGVTRDPDFGPVVAVGVGGSAVEERGAGAVAVAPVDLELARALVEEAGLTLALDELARVLVALGRLATDHPRIAAVDVNPLILGADGAVAVDALVVLGEEGAE
jgi:acetate---CoA ligase (ADP-forming)